ncbi:MAG TPA: hypothetical protein VGK67_10745 [Myxococcales bacterium]|jgi:hypothetical protein
MRKALLALSTLALAACGPAASTGTIVGFLVDGQTGQAKNVFDNSGNLENLSGGAGSHNQVYTIVDGNFVRASPCGQGFISESNGVKASGCFKFANVPYGELPVFAVYDGYEKFHGILEYPEDGAASQVVANIRIFPKNYTVDYKLMVNLDGRGINDVTVACQIRQESVALSTDGKFIPPLNTTSQALSATTGTDDTYGDGFWRIPGGDLVMGAKYHCEAFKLDLYDGRGVLTGSADFRAGVDAPDVSLKLAATKAADPDIVYAVESNADDQNNLVGSKGTLQITFNRLVEIVPGTADCQTANLSAPDTNRDGLGMPSEQNDVLNNGVSEQVSIKSFGDTGMSVGFSYQNSFDSKDVGARVAFAGIYVRPKGSSADGTDIRVIGGPANNGCAAAEILGDVPALQNARTSGDQVSVLHLY